MSQPVNLSAESVSRVITPRPLADRYLWYLAIYSFWTAWMVLITSAGPYSHGSFAEWVNGWHRWDAEYYFRIWNLGYGYDPHTLAYPPGFSWLVGGVSLLLRVPFDLAAIVVGVSSFFVAGVLAAEFISQRFFIPWWVVFIFHLSNPVGLYAFAPYSDCFFEVIFWAALIYAVRDPKSFRIRDWIFSSLLVFCAPLIRVTGFALIIWVLFRRWFALAVVPCVFLFLLGNWLVTGDWFYFIHVQQQFLMPQGWFLDGFRYHFHELLHPPQSGYGSGALFWVQTTVLPILSLILIIISATWLKRRGELILALTMMTVAIYSRNQAYWRSAFRYDLPLWPLLLPPWYLWAFEASILGRAGRASSVLSSTIFIWSLKLVIVVFVLIAFFFQWGLARRFHNGVWVF